MVQAELSLRLPDVTRHAAAGTFGKAWQRVRHHAVVPLPEDIDHEVLEWLRRATRIPAERRAADDGASLAGRQGLLHVRSAE